MTENDSAEPAGIPQSNVSSAQKSSMRGKAMNVRLLGETTRPGESDQNLLADSPAEPDHVDSFDTEGRSQLTQPLNDGNFFKSLNWSPDGTTLLASRADNTLQSFILPPDLLNAQKDHLEPYTSHILPSPVYATTYHPAYNLNSPASCLFLASPAHLPIRLLSPFSPHIVASYPLINTLTETYRGPHSLLFDTRPGFENRFYAGSESRISLFDVTRNGEEPIHDIKTIPSRRQKMLGGGVGIKGRVSALAMSCHGILAAGTFARGIGLYDVGGSGDVVGVFTLQHSEAGKSHAAHERSGAGVTQVLWTNCGRYLCIVERDSDGIGIWDIRGSGQQLAWLAGRKAMTMQRMQVDLDNTTMYAGGTDGAVRVWEEIGSHEGIIKPSGQFEAHQDVVCSAVLHPCGTILATSSGQRHAPNPWANAVSEHWSKAAPQEDTDHRQSASIRDESLRVWTLDVRSD